MSQLQLLEPSNYLQAAAAATLYTSCCLPKHQTNYAPQQPAPTACQQPPSHPEVPEDREEHHACQHRQSCKGDDALEHAVNNNLRRLAQHTAATARLLLLPRWGCCGCWWWRLW